MRPVIGHEYIDVNEKHFAVFSRNLAERVLWLDDEDKDSQPGLIEEILWICREYGELHNGESFDSPIEAMLASELLFADWGYGRIRNYLPPQDDYPEGVVFETQRRLDKYRVDFLVTVSFSGNKKQFVVECDGHDFHERTKEQASKDKARDRFFIRNNIPVLRFTGSDIFNRGSECAEEVGMYAMDIYEELGNLSGKNFAQTTKKGFDAP